MRWKGYGRSLFWPDYMYDVGIFLRVNGIVHGKSQDRRSAGRDSNPGHLEYEAGVPPNRLRLSLILSVTHSFNLCRFGCHGIVDWTREKISRKLLRRIGS